jgi:hypothetical protein
MPTPFQRRPGAQLRPSFSRDFAGLKTLDHGVGPAITFTRASEATFFDASGTLQTASNDAPRFDHDPVTGESRGLLIEEARTNLFQRSAEFDNAYWTKAQASITADAVIAPDGTQTADKLIEDVSNDTHLVSRNITVVTGDNYTLTVFAKKGERTFFRVQSFNASGDAENAIFNLDTGTFVSGTSGSTITSVGNGWFRCYVPVQNNSDTNSVVSFTLYSDASTSTYTGDGASGIYLWGAQIELGAFPTSYIPTTTAAATRSADSAVVTPISSFYNQAEGTLFAEYSVPTLPVSGTFPRVVHVGNQTNNNNRFTLTTSSSGGSLQHFVAYFVDAVGQLDKAQTTGSVGAIAKAAAAVALNSGHYAVNGSLVGTEDTSLSLGASANFTHLLVAQTAGGVTGAQHIRKIAYWPRRLSNTLLQQLTT